MKTYNIGFINSNDLLPEVTQFDIEEKESVTEMMVELINLFSGFLKENHINKWHIEYIEEVWKDYLNENI